MHYIWSLAMVIDRICGEILSESDIRILCLKTTRERGDSLVENTSKKVPVGSGALRKWCQVNEYRSPQVSPNSKYWLRSTHFLTGESIRKLNIFDHVMTSWPTVFCGLGNPRTCIIRIPAWLVSPHQTRRFCCILRSNHKRCPKCLVIEY